MTNSPFLLLTAAIDARNGAACLFTESERYRQYLHSFRWYMRFLKRHSDICRGILFCENSEADLTEFKKVVPEALSDRVEFISLPREGFRPEKGKSYNEMRTIDLSLAKSSLLGDEDVFVKLTGRYPVRNLSRLLSDLVAIRNEVSVCYFRMRFGGRHPDVADTRCIAFRKSVWAKHFAGLYKTADNTIHRHFENIVLDVLDKHLSEPDWTEGFSRPPLVLGKQGHVKHIGHFAVPKCVEWAYLLAQYLYQCRMARH